MVEMTHYDQSCDFLRVLINGPDDARQGVKTVSVRMLHCLPVCGQRLVQKDQMIAGNYD